jgi:hypothetical protein
MERLAHHEAGHVVLAVLDLGMRVRSWRFGGGPAQAQVSLDRDRPSEAERSQDDWTWALYHLAGVAAEVVYCEEHDCEREPMRCAVDDLAAMQRWVASFVRKDQRARLFAETPSTVEREAEAYLETRRKVKARWTQVKHVAEVMGTREKLSERELLELLGSGPAS